jgi:hypothetical protein
MTGFHLISPIALSRQQGRLGHEDPLPGEG